MADKACITIAAGHKLRSEKEQAAFLAYLAPMANSVSGGTGVPAGGAAVTTVPGSKVPDSENAQLPACKDAIFAAAEAAFSTKEAYMAAICKRVAVNGFEPVSDVFSLKEW